MEGGEDDDIEDERSINGIQQMMEDEAIAAGLNKKNANKQGTKAAKKSTAKLDAHPPTKRQKKFGMVIRQDEDLSKKQTMKRTRSLPTVPEKW